MMRYKLPLEGVDSLGLLLRAATAFFLGDEKEARMCWFVVQMSRRNDAKRLKPLIEWGDGEEFTWAATR